MGLTTRSCRLGGIISGRMKQWQLSRSTVVCATGLPAFGDGPALCRKRSRWSTPPSHCLPPTTSIEQRQNSPCHCFLNTLQDKACSTGVSRIAVLSDREDTEVAVVDAMLALLGSARGFGVIGVDMADVAFVAFQGGVGYALTVAVVPEEVSGISTILRTR